MGPDPTGLRDYRLVTFRRYGPQASDQDFDGYFDRLQGVPFGFNVHNLGQRNPTCWNARPCSGSASLHCPIPRWYASGSWTSLQARIPPHRWASTVTMPESSPSHCSAVGPICSGRRNVSLPAIPTSPPPTLRVIARHAHAATRIDVEPGFGVYWPPSLACRAVGRQSVRGGTGECLLRPRRSGALSTSQGRYSSTACNQRKAVTNSPIAAARSTSSTQPTGGSVSEVSRYWAVPLRVWASIPGPCQTSAGVWPDCPSADSGSGAG